MKDAFFEIFPTYSGDDVEELLTFEGKEETHNITSRSFDFSACFVSIMETGNVPFDFCSLPSDCSGLIFFIT